MKLSKLVSTLLMITPALGVMSFGMHHPAALAGQPNETLYAPFSDDWSLAVQEKVTAVTGTNVSLTSIFQGPDGLIGLTLQAPGYEEGQGRIVMWATPNAEAFILGDVLYAGVNLTDIALGKRAIDDPMENLVSLANESLSALHKKVVVKRDDIAALETSNGVLLGSAEAKRRVYVVFDPACPHCRSLYKSLHGDDTLIDGDALSIKWIPVNLMGKAEDQAAYVIENGAPGLRLIESSDELPSIELLKPATSDAYVKLANNMNLINDGYAPPSVPYVVWTDNAGEVVTVNGALTQKGIESMISGVTPRN